MGIPRHSPGRWGRAAALGVLSVSVGLTVVRAQDTADETIPSEAAGDTQASRVFDRYVVQGGWVTILGLIPLSVAAVALTLQYAAQVRRKTVIPDGLAHSLEELFSSKRYAEAVTVASRERSVLGYVIQQGLTAAREGASAMERAMEDALEERATLLHRKIEPLNLIGSIAPMIGLFGTVHGIIGMFGSIAEAGGVPIMSKISDDLGTALVATFWGLLIAIPSLATFGILRSRIDILMGECAVAAESLTTRFREPGGGQSTSAAKEPARHDEKGPG